MDEKTKEKPGKIHQGEQASLPQEQSIESEHRAEATILATRLRLIDANLNAANELLAAGAYDEAREIATSVEKKIAATRDLAHRVLDVAFGEYRAKQAADLQSASKNYRSDIHGTINRLLESASKLRTHEYSPSSEILKREDSLRALQKKLDLVK